MSALVAEGRCRVERVEVWTRMYIVVREVK